MLFVCFDQGPIQAQEERISAARQLFQLVDLLAPSLKKLYAVGQGPDQRRKIESLLRHGSSFLPDRLLRISTPYILQKK